MFLSQSPTFYRRTAVMKSDFQNVLCDAVRKRVFPNTGLHVAQLAYAIGCSDETLKNLLRKQHALSSHYVAGLIDFFARHNDHGFICELYPNACTPLVQRKREDDEAAAVGYALKKFMMSGAVAA